MRFTVFLLATAFLAASLGTAPADAKSRYSKASHQKADRVIVFKGTRQLVLMKGDRMLNSPLKKALLTGFHSTAKHNATKAVSPSSETMRTI